MKQMKKNKKWMKRAVSFATALVLLSCQLPMREIGDTVKLLDFNRFEITAQADATYDTTKFEEEIDGSIVNKVGDLSMNRDTFAEYSRCYYNDTEFAARHQTDTITLSTTSYWRLEKSGDNAYIPLGTESCPFAGKIQINSINTENQLFLMDEPFFNVVNDTVQFKKGSTETDMTLEFIRLSDSELPLFANTVVDALGDAATWKVVLSGADNIYETDSNGNHIYYQNTHTYGGVIGVMSDNSTLTLNFTDNTSASQGAWVKRGSSQGALCGEMTSGANLTANYTNGTSRAISIGDGTNIESGGLVGKMTGATLTLTTALNLNFDVKSENKSAGLLVGAATETSTLQVADGVTFQGAVTGTDSKTGGLVGELNQSDLTIGDTTDGNSTHSVTLDSVKVTGKNKVGGVIGNFVPSANNSNALTVNRYTLTDCEISGSMPSGIYGEYTASGRESIDVSHFTLSTSTVKGGSSEGGIFGKYIAGGNTTITGTFTPPKSEESFGGVIGTYSNSELSRTLYLNNLNVQNITQVNDNKALGGVLYTADGASYIQVDAVEVSVVGAKNSNAFGGIVSAIGTEGSKGCFIDLTGNFKLTTANSYKGGAIANSFKNGVLRLAGETDISGAQTANGYGQLIYENDTTLVYSKGTGSDTTWTFKRNSSTTASDLGQWGKVVRFSNMETDIVDVNSTAHTVTLQAASTSVSTPATFAKLALNMQLNDGNAHGALLFATGGGTKSTLLASTINVSGTIDLSSTGLLGFMRDGGNGKYLKSADNTFQGSPDFFTGSITGTNNAEIKLAVGEGYGCDSNGTVLDKAAAGGRIYLSENWGHDAQGLFSFAKGASISGLTVSGSMHVSRVAGSNHLYIAPLFGAMTNGATLTNVTVTTVVTADKQNDSKYYVGGISGVFDGNDTTESNGYSLSITGGSIKPEITMTGTVGSTDDHNHESNNVYVGGILGLLKGSADTKYNVSMTGSDISPQLKIDSAVGNVNNSFMGGMIGYVCENDTNDRVISINNVTMTNALIEQKSLYSGGLFGAFWDRTKVTIDGLTITGSKVDNQRNANDNRLSGLVYRATGEWNVNSLSISGTEFTATDNAHICFGLIANEGYHSTNGLYLNLKNDGYSLTNVTIPSSTRADYYADEIVARTASDPKYVVSGYDGTNGVGIININMNAKDTNDNVTSYTKITGTDSTGTYQNQIWNNDKLIANQNARYYYNLDSIKAKEIPTDGEKFLMWSLYNHYATTNIKEYEVLLNPDISSLTNVDLKGLSYYPVNVGSATLPAATFTFGYDEVKTYEDAKGSDGWGRYPASSGGMDKITDTDRRNQHYLMQNSLFYNVTGTLGTSGRITFQGVFGGNGNAGVLVGDTLTGTLNLQKGVTLKGVKPAQDASPMLINHINGTDITIKPELHLTGLRLEDYPEETSAVASAMIRLAEGTDMKLIFSDIKLDARNGASPI